MIIAFGGAEYSVAAIAVAILLYDCGMQLSQVGGSYRIAGIDPKARARLNGCSLLCIFAGQVSNSFWVMRAVLIVDIWNGYIYSSVYC